MNQYTTTLAAFLLAGNLGTAIAEQSIAFPGTGVSIIAPPGMAATQAGTALVDEAGETLIVIAQGNAKFNLENDPRWRQLYRNPPEKIVEKNIVGNLYRRTRATDGGAWDGWYFSASRDNKNLSIMISYSGNSPETFNRLRNSILTLTWDGSKSDPELAMGARMTPSGLQVVQDAFGSVSYNETGQAGAAGPSIFVQAMPVPLSKTNLIFPAGCEKILGAAFPAKVMYGPSHDKNGDIQFCEAWSKTVEPEMHYIALVRLPNSGLITVIGTAISAQFEEMLPKFRAAVHDLQPTKREQ